MQNKRINKEFVNVRSNTSKSRQSEEKRRSVFDNWTLIPMDDEAWVDYWAEVVTPDGRAILYMGTRESYKQWVKTYIH